MIDKIKTWSYAFLARFLNIFIPIKKRHWVFGADLGRSYREGSKYLLEYMLRHHPEFHCTFITQSREVYNDLRAKGIPCEINNSMAGIITICQADCEFTTQVIGDILYAYKKKGRHHFYLIHGQPYKKALHSLTKEYLSKNTGWKHDLYHEYKTRFINWLFMGRTIYDSEFYSASSDFLVPYLLQDIGGNVKVLGMPRNDALFHHDYMKNEKWLDYTKGKFVVMYMPTHRAYGNGELSPSPFIENENYQEWMRKNNVLLLVKNHPTMLAKAKNKKETDVIRDITKDRLDPQVCIYHSDVLITDYSSVWMDYLLLERPIIFYRYDNWESDDAGVHYDIKIDSPGHFCTNEEQLFELIKKTKENYEIMKPSLKSLDKYNKYRDGNSCERYYKEINKIVYEQ